MVYTFHCAHFHLEMQLNDNIIVCYVRLYLGCFEWVINLIYSTLFTNIPLPKFNQ